MPQVTNIGSSSTVVGGAVTITIGVGGVPAGAHIIVAVSWNLTASLPTIADTAGNTYLISGNGAAQANNNVAANGAGGVFRERTGGALVNGNTIVVTLGGTATAAAVDAFYVTGLAGVGSDNTGTYITSFGSSANPTGTSGIPKQSGELFVAIVTGATLISSFTQDTTNAAWGTSPPAGSISNAAPVLGVGFVVNSGAGALTYAPTFGTSDAWAVTIVGYFAQPPFINPNWRPGYSDDSPVWQAASRSATTLQNLALPKTVLRPSFYAPRPSDDFIWYPTLDNRNANVLADLTAQRFFGAGGQAPTKDWDPFYNYDIAESGWQQSSWMGTATFYTLLNKANNPFKYQPWKFGQDDSSGWQFQVPFNLNAAASVQFPPTFNWSYSASDDLPAWQSAPRKNFNLASVAEPVVNLPWQWKFNHDDSSNWQGKSVASSLLVPVLTKQPFTYQPWKFGQDDSSGWQSGTKARNLNLTSITEPFLNLPYLWKFSQDDFSHWQGKPTSSALLVPTLAKESFIYIPWQGGNEDPSGWQLGSRARNPNLISLIAPSVNLPWLWKFSQDDSSGWQGQPIPSALLIPELVKQPFTYQPWKFGQDDSSGWQFGPRARNPNLITLIEPTVNLPWLWKFSQDDSSGWQSGSKARNPNLVSVIEPFVNLPYLWKFSQDDSSGWQGHPVSSNLLVPILTAGGKAPIKFWRWDYDVGESFQNIVAKRRNPNLVSVVEPVINLPWLWKFSSDDSSGWQFASKSSSLLVPVLSAQASAPVWKFVTRPFDLPVWQFQGQLNINVTNTPAPPVVTQPILNWKYGSFTETPPWSGFYWRNNTILFPPPLPPPVLVTDPRFICTPNMLNSTLPTNQGSARIFTTTPKVTGVPYGNDLSTIDPLIERVTVTFNFDPWLASGIAVTSVVNVTATNAAQSLVLDPNPQGIVSGAAQIGSVPPTYPGAPFGNASRSVLQQFANCLPNATYLLQCTVLTSDNQELNLATHLPCAQLN